MRVTRTVVSIVVLAGVTAAFAQSPRLQVPVISGPPATNPQAADQSTATIKPEYDPWTDLMERYNQVLVVKKSQAIRISPKYAKPNAVTPWKMEIVREDAENLYLKNLPIEDPESPLHNSWLRHENAEADLSKLAEIENTYFILDPFAPVVPPPFTDRLTFVDRSDGLPSTGKWQMGFAHADMNHDGLEDLVFPPPRTGTRPYPFIFLQTDKGWREWTEARYPSIKFDYGATGVADFDGDGNLDIVIACHFLKNYVLYGDGKGDFTRYVELPAINPNVTSRALTIADFDGDGRPDVAFLSELDIQLGTAATLSSGLLYTCLNTKSGWRADDASGGRPNLFGDQIATGDFNGDKRPDLLISSHKNINRFLVYLNGGAGQPWTPVALDEFPFHAYVRGVAAVRPQGARADQAVMAFMQHIQSGKLGFVRDAIAVYTFDPTPDGIGFKDRKLVNIDENQDSEYTCVAAGDIDGDGLYDLALGRQGGLVQVFLQAPDGTFMMERGDEIKLGEVWVNSVQIMDLGKRGGRALVVSTSDSTAGSKTGGSVHCYVVSPKTTAAKAQR
jgi:hypothetical protein